MSWDPNTFGLWFTIGAGFVIGGVQVAGWKHRALIIGFIVSGVACMLAAIASPFLQKVLPSLTTFMTNAAMPSSWVVLLLFVAALVLLGPWAKNAKSPEADKDGPRPLTLPEMRSLLEEQANRVRGEVSGAYNHINQVRDDIAGIREKIADIERQIAVEWPNSNTVAEAFSNLDQATKSKTDRLEETIDRLQTKINERLDDDRELLKFAKLETSVRLFDWLLQDFPILSDLTETPTLEERGARADALNEYIVGVVMKGDATNFREQIHSIRRNSEAYASQYVHDLPSSKRPAIDHLLWRQFEITEAQALGLKRYFEGQRHKACEDLAELQRNISDRAAERDPT